MIFLSLIDWGGAQELADFWRNGELALKNKSFIPTKIEGPPDTIGKDKYLKFIWNKKIGNISSQILGNVNSEFIFKAEEESIHIEKVILYKSGG